MTFWDERYSSEIYAYGKEPNDFLRDFSHRIPRGRVLCLAEGEGRNAVFLAKQGREVTAVDQSAVGLRKAERLAEEQGVRIQTVQSDLAHFDLTDGAWQGIVSIWAHIPPAVRAGLHARCVKGLSPGGVFLLEAYSPRQLGRGTGGPSNVDWLVNLADVYRELIGLRFSIARELDRDVREGPCHNGVGSVVQILAEKTEDKAAG